MAEVFNNNNHNIFV